MLVIYMCVNLMLFVLSVYVCLFHDTCVVVCLSLLQTHGEVPLFGIISFMVVIIIIHIRNPFLSNFLS